MASRLVNIHYVAVVRTSSPTIIASYGKPDHEQRCQDIVSAGPFQLKVATGQRIRLDEGDFAYCFCGDAHGLAVVVICASSYPERIIFRGLIEDVRDRFLAKRFDWANANKNQLKSKFKSDLQSLCREYDDVKAKDKIAKLRRDLDVVRNTVQGNIKQALDNLESVSKLEEQTNDLLVGANKFKKDAKKIACNQYLILWKMRLIVVFAVLVIIGVIVGVICSQNDCGGGGDGGGSSTTPSGSR